jgi:hypothetical protein
MNSVHPPDKYRTREEFAEALLDYINTKLPIVHPKSGGHDPFERSTLLFEVGGIDSLSIIHIVSLLEAAMGSHVVAPGHQHEKLSNGRGDRRSLLASQKP